MTSRKLSLIYNFLICASILNLITVNGQWCVTEEGCPSGSYSSNGCNLCWVSAITDDAFPSFNQLTCDCLNPNTQSVVTSTLTNAYACNGCIANVNGHLTCLLPKSSKNGFGYQERCHGCSMNSGTLICLHCDNVEGPFSLPHACDCPHSIQFVNNMLLCLETPAPTDMPTRHPSLRPTKKPTNFPTNEPTNFPTNEPTNLPTKEPTFFPTKKPTFFPTKNPTRKPTLPLNPAPLCGNYWVFLQTQNGLEAAPQKACSQFKTPQGCQYQNWCCFEYFPESTTDGICVTAGNGIPDCPTLTQEQCQTGNALTYCQWTNYGGGLCQRICPGDPKTLCVPK